MDVIRNSILVEEEHIYGNIYFVRNYGENCRPLSNNYCEGARGLDTAEFDLWDDLRISCFVRNSDGLCSLSNIDFVR